MPNALYPNHLARLVCQSLATSTGCTLDRKVVLRLIETLYFASLKTNEKRPCTCTVDFIDPKNPSNLDAATDRMDNGWSLVRFRQAFPLSVRTILKLADAADPNVASIAVTSGDDGELLVVGLVDQELRYGDYVALDANSDPQRPGIFQATITGVGCVSVYKNYSLVGALEQNHIISKPHDALWEGPVYQRLYSNLHETLSAMQAAQDERVTSAQVAQVQEELLVRWQNAICRLLFNIQKYGHGGGLLIVPATPSTDVNIKYELHYDRLPRALLELAKLQIQKRQTADAITAHCRTEQDTLPCEVHFDAVHYQREVDRLKSELLGCVRFVASLSRVDGFVLLDKSLVVHGFGVEATADVDLTDIHIAGDAAASPRLQRQVPFSEYGTRHRAMMRYCSENEKALGFVISQDGDIRAIMKHQGQLMLWENINVQLAYREENRGSPISGFSPDMASGLFQYWTRSFSALRSA